MLVQGKTNVYVAYFVDCYCFGDKTPRTAGGDALYFVATSTNWGQTTAHRGQQLAVFCHQLT